MINHHFWAPYWKWRRRQTYRKVKFAKFQKPRDLDLELGSSQSHICMHITCRTTGLPNRVTLKQYGNMAIWNSCNVDISWSLNSRDNFSKRKFENWAPTRSRIYHPFLSPRQNGGGDRPIESAIFGNFRKFRSPVTLTLTLDRIEVTSCSTHSRPTCSISMPNRMWLSTSNTEIWPFEVCVMSTFREVWTHVIAFW